MPKRKMPELTAEEQHKRFVEAAKEAGLTRDENELEAAMRKIATATKDQRGKRKG